MKILIIDKEAIYKNGVVIYNLRLEEFLKKNNHEVYYVRFSKEKAGKKGNMFYVPFFWGIEKFWLVVVPSHNTLSLIKSAIKSVKPDIVYTTLGISTFDVFLAKLCHDQNIPIASTLHVDISKRNNIYDVFLKSLWASVYLPSITQFNLFHALSQRTKDFFAKFGIKRNKIIVIPNGVDSSLYSPGESSFAKKNNIKKGILFLGRLSWQKNPELVIESFLKTNPPPATKLVIVGAGELDKTLREKYQDERIIFTGFIEKDTDRIDIIRSCQIFCLPSRGEGMSLSLLETMSCRLAPVVSDVGANKEVVAGTGSVIPLAKIKEELPRILNKYINDENLTKELGAKARERIKKNYNLEKNFTTLLNSFEKTIKNYRTLYFNVP